MRVAVAAVPLAAAFLIFSLLPSTTRAAYSLTVNNASSAHYALLVMTWVAVIFTPVVLLYQGWTYWIFRQRLTRPELPAVPAAPGPAGAGQGGPGMRPGATGPGPQPQVIPGQP